MFISAASTTPEKKRLRMGLWNFLDGKKTYLGCLALGLLAALWGLDQLCPGEWLTQQQYEAAAAFITSVTGASMRWAITKQQ